MSFNRVVQAPFTLSDGVHLPVGTHFSMPTAAIAVDERLGPGANEFDPMRFYKQRQDPAETNLHQFTTTEKTSLHFGYGKWACPGRFFAMYEIKMILAYLLLRYDFKFPDEGGRPENLFAHEYVFPDQDARILFKERSATGIDLFAMNDV